MAGATEVTMTQILEDKKGDIVLILSLAVRAGEDKKVLFLNEWKKLRSQSTFSEWLPNEVSRCEVSIVEAQLHLHEAICLKDLKM